MRRIGVLIVVLVVGLSILPPGSQSTAQCLVQPDYAAEVSAAFVPGQLLVRFRPAVTQQRAEQLVEIEGIRHLRRIEALDTEVLQLPPWLSVSEAMERLLQYHEIEIAEPNYILQMAQVDDPGLGNQWAPQQIEAPAAWALTPGDPDTIIAIADTGIDYMHSELAPNIWTNPGEIAANGLDDDGNGYVDDVHGWDFANDDPEPLDDHFHGTHVAGIAAAADNDNPEGLVGICPGCTVMAVKVLDANGAAPLDVVANGMIYATDNGAKVINLSLGSSLPAATLESAVDYAWDHGVVVVAAAGNNGTELAFYPAAFPNAVGVASTNMQDYRSCFSNYGSDLVSVAAPGELIYSTVPRDASGNEGYATHSGTSMASPHVSGLVGLLFSQDPARTNAEVRALLESTAEDLGPAGGDPFFGSGRINSADETYQPALALDGTHLHLAFSSLQGAAHYRVWFSRRALDGGPWIEPQPLTDGSYDAVRPALFVDPGNDRLHLVAGSFDNAPYVAYARSEDAGATWSQASQVYVSTGGAENSRYAAVHAHGDHVYLAGRTVELVFGLFPRLRVFTVRSTDGGSTWGDLTILAEHIGFLSGAYGVSLAGVGDRLYLGYEHAGTIYFRHSQDGVAWTEASNLGSGHWPSVTQARDGRGGSSGRARAACCSATTWGAWAPAETVLQGSSLNVGYYPNLELGASGERLEWVFTHCSGSPFRLVVDGRPVTPGPPPVSIYLPIILNQKR
ncbi:MAG: S8 family serine peptidase [Anaerolineae bacterium]